MTVSIRPAAPDDCGLILSFIRELADYERLAREVAASEEDLARALFCPTPAAYCDIAAFDGRDAGFALWFYTFSTFNGRRGLYLEDLFVRPSFRGRGVGRALMAQLARRCAADNLGRLEWSVLKWNASAISFYESLGAVAMDGWTVYRTDGDALARLGA